MVESIFECGICFKPYNHNDKKPLSLPCGHSFCLECIKKLLKHLKRKKIKASDLENQEAKQCSICFEDYAENDTVVILPCDTRHIFHDSCISEWLKEKDTCPLCKTQITAETLK